MTYSINIIGLHECCHRWKGCLHGEYYTHRSNFCKLTSDWSGVTRASHVLLLYISLSQSELRNVSSGIYSFFLAKILTQGNLPTFILFGRYVLVSVCRPNACSWLFNKSGNCLRRITRADGSFKHAKCSTSFLCYLPCNVWSGYVYEFYRGWRLNFTSVHSVPGRDDN